MTDTPSGGGTATATAPEPGHGFDEHRPESLGLRIQHVLHARPTLGPLAVLVLAIIAFSLLSGRFLSAANLSLVLAQVTVIAVLALGQTLIILTAGIDLSVGAIAVFSSILMAKLATDGGMPGAAGAAARLRARHRDGRRSTACWSPGSSCRRSSSPWAR